MHVKSKLRNFIWDPWQTMGGRSIIFDLDHVHTKSKLQNFRWDPWQSKGGQSSSTLTMIRLNLNFEISGENLGRWGVGVNHLWPAHVHTKSKLQNFIWDPWQTMGEGGQSSLTLTICTLNLNFKISGEILDSQRGVNHLQPWPCAH